MGKATRQMTLFGESSGDAAESETLSMRGTFQHGNRESLETSSPEAAACRPSDEERAEKVKDQAFAMHVSRKSDGFVVPKKQTNNASPTVAAESVEGRGPTKGNASQQATDRTQCRKPVSLGL